MNLCHDEQHFCVARRCGLVVVVWGREVEAADLERLAKTQREVIAEHGHCLVMSIIRAGLSMSVKDDVRRAGEQNLRDFAATTLGSAMVVEAGGIRASFFRSVITGIHLATRSKVQQKVFDNIDEAVGWLMARPGVDMATFGASQETVAKAYELADRFGQASA